MNISTLNSDSFVLQVYISEDAMHWELVFEKYITMEYFQNVNLIVDAQNKITRFVYIKHDCAKDTDLQITAIANPYLIPFRNVNIIYDESYYEGLTSSLFSGTYEKSEIEFSLNYINDDDIVLELGASIGVVSTVILKNKKIKHYICVEANPDLIEIIQKNHTLNNVEAEIINAVVAGNYKTKPQDFYIRKGFLASSLSDKGPFLKCIRVQSICLQELLEYILPSFIICDIEGAEFDVFKNLDLSCVNCMSIELHYTNSYDIQNFFDFMEDQNFKIIRGDRFFTKRTVCLFQKKA